MFDNEFYPTPRDVYDQMGVDVYGKVIVELQAGKGDLVKYMQDDGAKEVLACEKNEQLRKILAGSCRLIGDDAFQVKADDISHVHMIVMNPPFSNAERHILHAWKIAPEGCEIVSLCNKTTIYNDYYVGGNRELQSLIKNYGEKQDLGSCFDQAERKTNVQVGLVRLFKPMVSSESNLDGFYYDLEEEQGSNGMMQYNEIRAVVNSYVAAVKCFDRFQAISTEMNSYTKMVGFGSGFKFSVSSNEQVTGKEEFAKGLQKQSWTYLFNKMNLQKFVTKGVMGDINKFIESRVNYPFTMKNIYRMFEIIVGTREQTMNRAIEEAIDNFTQHTKENRFGVEGWVTNSGYMLNKKFISNYIADSKGSGKASIKNHGYHWDYLVDLVKALCYVTGKDYDSIPDIRMGSLSDEDRALYKNYGDIPYELKYKVDYDKFQTNKWYDWGFFQFKLYMKGTGHFKFKNEDDWAILNRAYAKIKGQVLPEKI